MKMKKASIITLALACIIVAGTAGVFATSENKDLANSDQSLKDEVTAISDKADITSDTLDIYIHKFEILNEKYGTNFIIDTSYLTESEINDFLEEYSAMTDEEFEEYFVGLIEARDSFLQRLSENHVIYYTKDMPSSNLISPEEIPNFIEVPDFNDTTYKVDNNNHISHEEAPDINDTTYKVLAVETNISETESSDNVTDDNEDDTTGKIKLTIEKVIELSKKGDTLTWGDFEPYDNVDIGSGLYILLYDMEKPYYIIIGGTSMDINPMYIHLVSAQNQEDFIDIRTESVEDFIEK